LELAARSELSCSQIPEFKTAGTFDFGEYSYILARMPYELFLMFEAAEDLKRLTARQRAEIRAALETHLSHEPQKVSRSRIKRLRGLSKPQYRLRVGEVRISYDVTETTVEVLAIMAKQEVESWLAQFAKPA
jgi:mRNA interferase RelE/StbE